MDDVAWERLAEPQPDQYDTGAILRFARERGYQRREASDEPVFCNGRVALRAPLVLFPSTCVPASVDHPNIRRAESLLRLWPVVYEQFVCLTESVTVFLDEQYANDYVTGSVCGDGGGFGMIASTINNHVGFAEALVHEMGHHKLRVLGVDVESAERIIVNSPQEKYHSPIRHDVLRPMPAVFHAQYSYTYITALDIAIIQAAQDLTRDRIIARDSVAVNLPKLEFGYEVIRKHAKLDSAGERFMSGFYGWLDRVIANGYVILERFSLQPEPFIHPYESSVS